MDFTTSCQGNIGASQGRQVSLHGLKYPTLMMMKISGDGDGGGGYVMD